MQRDPRQPPQGVAQAGVPLAGRPVNHPPGPPGQAGPHCRTNTKESAHAEDRHHRAAQEGDILFNVEEKIFPDYKANEGDKAYVFMHTVPFEGSVGLVNMLTATRLQRKGFELTFILYGPGVLWRRRPAATRLSGTRASRATSATTSS